MKHSPLIRHWFAALALCTLLFGAMPAHADETAKTLLSKIDQATWITEGHGPRLLYIFFDPNCPFCHKLFKELRPHVEAGKVEVRWIPVGILTSSSQGKAAAMLEAKDPLKALYKNEQGWNTGPTPGGGLTPELHASRAVLMKLNINAALLSSSGAPGVPLTVFRADNGKDYSFPGAPDAQQLAAILKHVK
ncbi:thiol:disulfide interchange protein DsbG [Acidihalobacter ferrooxydans]|uniref:Thiol:disulfide interchange protein n=1 Tax=Acidihalobacter ferrooxydans TaxID=1765967 RepID=A0A1P8UI63_9GAMM|nr:thiol:disulfide interchange protein DsbG [Acidihalobacter ferrooxydans]APZ43530.1 thiol:disulfide interchange protein DsbG [Acidihalobacter ferrooxydans]